MTSKGIFGVSELTILGLEFAWLQRVCRPAALIRVNSLARCYPIGTSRQIFTPAYQGCDPTSRLKESVACNRYLTMLDDLKTQLGSSMHTVRRFLQRPITVTQGNVTLGVPASALKEQARDERRRREKRMRRDLYQMLEQHPGSRQIMRHLDLAERTLRSGGLKAFEALPIRVIAKALAQMERLVWDWSPAGLAELRSRMAVMVKNRSREVTAEAISTASLELEMAQTHVTDVTEVEHAEFEEMERSWAGQMPAAIAAAKAESEAQQAAAQQKAA
jgi:hypothetical protein